MSGPPNNGATGGQGETATKNRFETIAEQQAAQAKGQKKEQWGPEFKWVKGK